MCVCVCVCVAGRWGGKAYYTSSKIFAFRNSVFYEVTFAEISIVIG